MAESKSHRVLREAFGSAAPGHFDWQTTAPVVSDEERRLVLAAFTPLGKRVLDLGCGEGATLFHLGAPSGAVGVDLFEDKLEFARTRLPNCKFVVGSALELPFEAGSFDHVLVRDVIHHLDDPARCIGECARVLAPGGRLDVLEPCRNNPLIAVHALANRAERGELRSTLGYITGLVARRFNVVSRNKYQPLPLHRLLFHPDLGMPDLAERSVARSLVAAAERLAGSVLPRALWAYLHVRAERRGAGEA
jgi:SAM-dependent methyltransferase